MYHLHSLVQFFADFHCFLIVRYSLFSWVIPENKATVNDSTERCSILLCNCKTKRLELRKHEVFYCNSIPSPNSLVSELTIKMF